MPDFNPRPAFEAALLKINGNLKPFETLFPDNTSVKNIYYPRRLNAQEKALGLQDGANIGWTTAFWTGQLWLAYEWTGNHEYRRVGEIHLQNFKERIEKKILVDHHDMGFLYTLAAIAPWRLTGNLVARETALLAARTLMRRFHPAPGIFQAWGSMDDAEQRGRTIVDCMMNLPLLYWATETTGDPFFHHSAERHALRTAENFIRPDATTFHTFYFDTETGAAKFGQTHQGYSDDSCWARGQAWAIYGFVLSYRYTRNPLFLQASQRVAEYFLAHLPKDKVAYWDLIFNDGSPEERDSSASAIAACGLLEIARWETDRARAAQYRTAAVEMTQSLYENYSTKDDPVSNALILHGVYGKPNGNGIDEANLWGDYFYLEALMRLANPEWRIYW